VVTSKIRVALFDEQAVFVDSLAFRMDAEEDISVVGRVSRLDQALRMVLETKPDVAVIDIAGSGNGIFGFVSDLASRSKQVQVVILTDRLSEIFANYAIRLGVRGYLLKTEPYDVVIDAVRRVVRGQLYLSSDVKRHREGTENKHREGTENKHLDGAENKHYRIDTGHGLTSLTGRQLDVLRQLALGHSVKEIARQMHLSPKSVDSHKYRIMRQLDIHDRVALARYAIREGLVLP